MSARDPSRRQTLKALTALAGVAATGCHVTDDTPQGARDTDDVGRDSDTGAADPLSAIRTIVVLMMENRTFDHYFGALSLIEGREDVDGLTAEMSNPDADGVEVPVFRLERECLVDPPHGWAASHDQFADGTNRGFVLAHQGGRTATSREAMGYHVREDLPVYYAMADAHAICDRWFSSVMSSTWPNRIYSMCATSEGMKGNDFGRTPFEMRSIFDQLTEAGVSWKVYFHDLPFASLLARTGTMNGEHLRPIDEFYEDVARGELPQVVFIEPSYAINDDHPPHPPMLGQLLVGNIYTSLAQSDYWDGLLMVVDYDEHGGFFDHVPPPTTADDHADEGFSQLGFRVPAIVAGPWAKPGACVHTVYDHTSVLKTIQERFGLEPLTARNAAANPLWDCLDLDAMAARAPRPPARMPVIEVTSADYGNDCRYGVVQPGQEEMDRAADQGLIDPRFDRRHLSAEMLDRMLVRAETLGLLRFTDV